MLIRLRKRKGQAISSDFIMGLSIFLIMLTGSAIIWNTTTLKYSQSERIQFMQGKAFSISDAMIRTEGAPAGWNSTSVRLIGVAQKDSHILNQSKLKELMNLTGANPSLAKRIWGIEGYEYSINVTNSSGTVFVLSDGTMLQNSSAELAAKKDLVPIRRIVLINESGSLSRAALTFMIWR